MEYCPRCYGQLGHKVLEGVSLVLPLYVDVEIVVQQGFPIGCADCLFVALRLGKGVEIGWHKVVAKVASHQGKVSVLEIAPQRHCHPVAVQCHSFVLVLLVHLQCRLFQLDGAAAYLAECAQQRHFARHFLNAVALQFGNEVCVHRHIAVALQQPQSA